MIHFLVITTLLAQTIGSSFETANHIGYKDFWSHAENDSVFIEAPRDVSIRAHSYFSEHPTLFIKDVQYVLYLMKALDGLNQMIENAPIAVERIAARTGESSGTLYVTNTEVHRYTFITNDTLTWESIMSNAPQVVATSTATKMMLIWILPFLLSLISL